MKRKITGMIFYRSGCGRNEPNGDAPESRDDATDDELSHYAESHEQSPGETCIQLMKHLLNRVSL